MGIRWAEPFDPYGGDEAAMVQGPWAQIDGEWALSNVNPRTGGWCLRMTPTTFGNQMVRRVVGDSLPEVKIGYGFYLANLPSSESPDIPGGATGQRIELMSFRDAANTVHLTLVLGTNGQLVLYRGSTMPIADGWRLTTFIARSNPTILVPARAYSHLEYAIKIHATDGYVEVRLNQVTIMNLTGLNTVGGGAAECSQIALKKEGIGAFSGPIDIDDMILSDTLGSYNTGFVGDKKAYYLAPDSDTAQADFTPSTGSTSYGVIDESPPNDGDYLSLVATTGKTDVGCTNLPGDAISVAAVIPFIRSWKSDAGVCDMAPGVLAGSTPSTPVGQPQTTAPNYYFDPIEENPDTLVPFTPADVNAVKLRMERTA